MLKPESLSLPEINIPPIWDVDVEINWDNVPIEGDEINWMEDNNPNDDFPWDNPTPWIDYGDIVDQWS